MVDWHGETAHCYLGFAYPERRKNVLLVEETAPAGRSFSMEGHWIPLHDRRKENTIMWKDKTLEKITSTNSCSQNRNHLTHL